MAVSAVRERILVIDHHAPSLELMALGLERFGFAVAGAPSGAAGLAVVEAGDVDLVCLDQMTPGADGVAVCREIRRASAVPVLVLSSSDDIRDAAGVLAAGADDIVRTPFHLSEVRERICALLRRRDLLDRLRGPAGPPTRRGPTVVVPHGRV
ncbi:response regulator transcription factor [Pseudonocardia sp. RS010]|uniref:response regulator transcription factor n=1 Tax=Pseudonocardia sp. RS010 TaxID=3385979 RepID=UPI0039A31911